MPSSQGELGGGQSDTLAVGGREDHKSRAEELTDVFIPSGQSCSDLGTAV